MKNELRKLKNTDMIGFITIADTKHMTSFRTRRKKSGMTLREVEDITGISNSYLSQLETGKIKNPSFEVVIILHNLYKS